MKRTQHFYLSIMLAVLTAVLPIGNTIAMTAMDNHENPSHVETSMQHTINVGDQDVMVMSGSGDCEQCDTDNMCSVTHCSTFHYITTSSIQQSVNFQVIDFSSSINENFITTQKTSLFRPPRA